MSLISGRRRSATVLAGNNCVLIETPRRSMIRLIASVEAVKRDIDRVFIARAIQTRFAPEASYEQIADVVESATIQRYKAGDVVFNEGEAGDCLHLVRVGSLTISRTIGGKEVVLSYVPAGNYVGEMALLGEGKRTATAKAAIATETVRLDGAAFKKLVQRNPVLRLRLQAEYRQRTAANLQMQAMPSGGDIITFLIGQGAGEATDILLIDESLCVRCDNCEKACAETHGGTSRLRPRGRADLRQRARADLVPALRASALHEGLPAGRDPPRAQRRGLHRRQLHRLRQLRAQLPLRRDQADQQAEEEARPAGVADVRRRARARARRRTRRRARTARRRRRRRSSATCARTCPAAPPACAPAPPARRSGFRPRSSRSMRSRGVEAQGVTKSGCDSPVGARSARDRRLSRAERAPTGQCIARVERQGS